MDLKIPSLHKGSFLQGIYPVWDVLLNRFGLSRATQEFVIPTVVGFFSGLILIILAWIIRVIFKKIQLKYSFSAILLFNFIIIGSLLSPTKLLAGEGSIGTCPNSNIIRRYENIGAYLSSIIPANSLVYWEGYTPLSLLYLHNIQIFPGQLNMKFYYREGGDPDYLEKKGYWNEELATRWIKEADYLLFSQESFQFRLDVVGEEIFEGFEELPMSENINPCDENSRILIYKRR
jgi:hypothetical protein